MNVLTRISTWLWPIKHIQVNPMIDLHYYRYLDFTTPYHTQDPKYSRTYDSVIVATHNDKQIANIKFSPETGQIGLMVVDEKYHKNNIMTTLFNTAVTDMQAHENKPEYCWAVTNTDPNSGPFKLFKRFNGEYSKPAHISVGCDGMRFKIDYSKIYLGIPVNNITTLEDRKGDIPYDFCWHVNWRFGMTLEEVKKECQRIKDLDSKIRESKLVK
jgi:hypothetical protein